MNFTRQKGFFFLFPENESANLLKLRETETKMVKPTDHGDINFPLTMILNSQRHIPAWP